MPKPTLNAAALAAITAHEARIFGARATARAEKEARHPIQAQLDLGNKSPAFSYKRRELAPKAYTPSPQQQAYFDWIERGSGSLLLEAVAGAGKTTTLVQGLAYMQGDIFFGAYGNKAAADIKEKVREARLSIQGRLYTATVHGAGLGTWKRLHKTCQIDDRKVRNIYRGLPWQSMGISEEWRRRYEPFVCKMVSFAKQFIFGVKTPAGVTRIADVEAWKDVAEHFGLDAELPERAEEVAFIFARCIEVFTLSANQCRQVIDFDDMLFAPLYHEVQPFRNDWVLIDERQDTNPARREFARRMLKPGGRLVAVGDTHQAIYGFTGADGDADKWVETFGCARLPLTYTYRCPKAVVKVAQQWVAHIQAHPDAPEGVAREVAADPVKGPWFVQDRPNAESVILCRYTAPLVRTAYLMLREKMACKIEGRDIGNGLIATMQRRAPGANWRQCPTFELKPALNAWLAQERAKAEQSGDEGTLQKVTDQVETLHILCEMAEPAKVTATVQDVIDVIEEIFGDNVQGVLTLSTGHKSKGREWKRVYWLQVGGGGKRRLMPWEVQQEINILYVIATRAQEELVFVGEQHTKRR